MGSGLKTGRRIFYLKVEKVEEGKRRSLKNLFDFFDFAVYEPPRRKWRKFCGKKGQRAKFAAGY
jgi:hypothetical protein